EIREKVQDVLDKTDLDEKVIEIKDKIVDTIIPKDNNVEESSKKDIKNDELIVIEKKKSTRKTKEKKEDNVIENQKGGE
ncbi:MAG: hypothetical protein IKE70_04165, partial [Bacilli bacterium]|nr:hypothetical protein [Bacilli bacterium]